MIMNISHLKEDRLLFLRRWEEEELTSQLNRIKKGGRIITDETLRSNINWFIERCLREKIYWESIVSMSEDEIILILDELRTKLACLFDLEFIQQIVSMLYEATHSWGNIQQYLGRTLKTYNYLIKELGNQHEKKLIELIKIDIDLIQHLNSFEDSFDRLKQIEDFKYTQDEQTHSINLQDLVYRDHPWKEEILSFQSIRSERFGVLKKLIYYRIPQLLLYCSYEQRNVRIIIIFLIDFVLTSLNIWDHYAATCRFRFRLGENFLQKMIIRSDLQEGMKALEIFGNIPFASWISAFLGLDSTVIDFHYQVERSDIYEYKRRFMELARKGDENGCRELFQIEREKEMRGNGLKTDITRFRIDPINTVKVLGHEPWFYNDIKKRYNPVNLNLDDLDSCLSNFRTVRFDRFFIDPPHGFETRYQNPEVWSLVENSIKLVKHTAKSNSKGFFIVPPIKKGNDRGSSWRNQLYEILDEFGMNYEIPGKKNRLLLFTFSNSN